MSFLVKFAFLISLFETVLADVYLSVSPSGLEIRQIGEDMILVCSIKSNFALECHTGLTWYKGENQISNKRVSAPGNLTLNLENPQFADSDLYTCVAEEYGLLEMVSVTFGAPPSIPNTSGQNSTNSLDVLVFWKTNYTDTNLPTIYKFEYRTRLGPDTYPLCPGNKYSPCPNSDKGENTCFLKNHHYCSQIDYTITAMNALGKRSHNASFTVYEITIPNSPINLEFVFTDTWEISWQKPSDWKYDDELWYWVQYWSEKQNLEGAINSTSLTNPANPPKGVTYHFTNDLDPFTLYYVGIAAKFLHYGGEKTKADEGWSEPIVETFRTKEVQPQGRFAFNINRVFASSNDPHKVNVFLQWEPMSKKDGGGIIRGYNISIMLNRAEYWSIQLNNSITEYVIREQLDQSDYVEYSLQMVAFNKKGSTKTHQILLSDYPLSSPQSEESATIAAAVVVCIGLITIVSMSILFRYIYKTIKEAQSIPDVPSSIAAELAQDSDGYMFINGTGSGKYRITKEVFDIVPSKVDLQEDLLKYEQSIDNSIEVESISNLKVAHRPIEYTSIPANEVQKKTNSKDIINTTDSNSELNMQKQSCDKKITSQLYSEELYTLSQCVEIKKKTSEVDRRKPASSSIEKNLNDSNSMKPINNFSIIATKTSQNNCFIYQPNTTQSQSQHSNLEFSNVLTCNRNGYVTNLPKKCSENDIAQPLVDSPKYLGTVTAKKSDYLKYKPNSFSSSISTDPGYISSGTTFSSESNTDTTHQTYSEIPDDMDYRISTDVIL